MAHFGVNDLLFAAGECCRSVRDVGQCRPGAVGRVRLFAGVNYVGRDGGPRLHRLQDRYDRRRSREFLGDDINDGKENRLVKVNVMYPYTEGARFDHAYYRDRHMPMVKSMLGSACAYYTIERGVAGRAPGSLPAFVAMCAFICDSAEGYEAAIRQRRPEILADIANYTDIVPVVQVSEVVVERSDR